MKSTNKMLFILLTIFALLLSACGSSNTSEEAGEAKAGEKEQEEFTPDDQVDMLVGFAAGGGGDLTARTAVKALNDAGIVDSNFVVENIPGASGSLALMELKKRKGDPNVLIQIPNIAEPLWQDGKVDAEFSDFTPIAQVAVEPMIITVNKDTPFQTIEELLEALKEDPSKIIISTSSAIDGQEPFRWDSVRQAYGIEKELNIMTTGGASESFQNVLGGHSDVAMLTQSLLKGHVESGDLRPLAVLADERVDAYPDVPTLKEVGYDVTYYRVRGFWAAGDISPAAVAYWENAFKEMVESDVWKQYTEDNGLDIVYKNSEEYSAYIEEEAKEYQAYLETLDK